MGSTTTFDNSTYIAKAHIGIPDPHTSRTKSWRSLASTITVLLSTHRHLHTQTTSRSGHCLIAFPERGSGRCNLCILRCVHTLQSMVLYFSNGIFLADSTNFQAYHALLSLIPEFYRLHLFLRAIIVHLAQSQVSTIQAPSV